MLSRSSGGEHRSAVGSGGRRLSADLSSWHRHGSAFPFANADNDGSVYVDEFEVAWVCEYDPDLGYIWRSLGPVHRPPTEE